MNTITWLHLSDLHFRAGVSYDDEIVKSSLLQDIQERYMDEGLQVDFIIISGDIAFSGQTEEYEQAKLFLDKLLHVTNLNKNHLFLVPGNHDVDRRAISVSAKAINNVLVSREAVADMLSDKDSRQMMFRHLETYVKFLDDYFDELISYNDQQYFYVRNINVSGREVAILGLNSVWVAQGDEQPGKLILGERQVRDSLEAAKGADVKIAVLHHPFDWLRDESPEKRWWSSVKTEYEYNNLWC